jgi:hypothetical protein
MLYYLLTAADHGFISGMIPGLAHYWGEKRVAEWIDST